MSKALVDRKLLENLVSLWAAKGYGKAGSPGHCHEKPGIWDKGNGPLAGKPCAECAIYDAARAILAQPAEAEGVRDYLTEFAEGEVEAKTAIEELQDALSVVTAERDRLESMLILTATRHFALQIKDRADDKKLDECLSEGIAMLEAERDQYRAEVEGMRKAFMRMRNVAAGYSNCCEFDSANTRRLEREFEAADELFRSSAAMAAKEA